MAFLVSIFLENKIGHFEKVTHVLKEQDIDIKTMTLTNTVNGWGILNLLVSKPEKACSALAEKGFTATLREVLALEMQDRIGGLDDLLMQIARVGISFDNAFGRNAGINNPAVLVLDVPDIRTARERLKEAGISELPDEVVYGNGH